VTACVFTGPTLAPDAARAALDARYLPPVRQGDVHRAVRRYRPWALGIVDGYFQHVPAVWHKEILWAMAEGVHVFGAASMGALRAAELAPFGMRGVGRIFEAYRDGRLAEAPGEPFEDDDEVAVVHGPAESGFPALSEAMVNIRCTLAAAAGARVVGAGTRDALVRLAKARFYPDRHYRRLLADAREAGLPAAELAALAAWLPAGRVDQKRDDALAMLGVMRDLLAGDPAPVRAGYAVQGSDAWEAARAGVLAEPDDPPDGDPGAAERVLDEVRLDGRAHAEARRAAALRRAGLAAQPEDPGAAEGRGPEAVLALRRRLGLLTRPALDAWLRERDLDGEALARLAAEEACLERLAAAEAGLAPHILDHLRLAGDYPRYAARARAKAEALAGHGPDQAPAPPAARLALALWFFEDRRGEAVPEDLAGHAAAAGFADLDAFFRALWREYRFVSRAEAPGGAGRPAVPAGTPRQEGSA
jgi:hypothetical protein